MRDLLVIFSIQFSVLLSIAGFAGNAHAGSLWSVDEIYHLGEVLHSSRYDYDHGMEISFKRYSFIDNKSHEQKSNCVESSSQEILEDVSQAISNHLGFYYDDEFEFDEAFEVLQNHLSSLKELKKCELSNGKKLFLDASNQFLVSYKLL